MADAAENAVYWARLQFWVALGGTIFLVWNLRYAHKSAEAATDAASAARDAISVESDRAERQLRAYVHLKEAHVMVARSPHGVWFKFTFQNFGQTPACIVGFGNKCELRGGAERLEREVNFAERDMTKMKITVPPGGRQLLTFARAFEGEMDATTSKRLHIVSRIEYTDSFNQLRITQFAGTVESSLDNLAHYGTAGAKVDLIFDPSQSLAT